MTNKNPYTLNELEMQPLVIGACCGHVARFLFVMLSKTDRFLFYLRPNLGMAIGTTTTIFDETLPLFTEEEVHEFQLDEDECEGCRVFVSCMEKAGDFETSMERMRK